MPEWTRPRNFSYINGMVSLHTDTSADPTASLAPPRRRTERRRTFADVLTQYVLPLVAMSMLGFAGWYVATTRPVTKNPPPPIEPARSPYADTLAAAGIVEAQTENISVGSATPGVVVAPGLPELFRSGAAAPSGLEGRRALAEWIASPANPLTARVAANRVWQHSFGRALVATPNDFGAAGLAATHPELLDWLAAELVDSGWSLKNLHLEILQSRAYRM